MHLEHLYKLSDKLMIVTEWVTIRVLRFLGRVWDVLKRPRKMPGRQLVCSHVWSTRDDRNYGEWHVSTIYGTCVRCGKVERFTQ